MGGGAGRDDKAGAEPGRRGRGGARRWRGRVGGSTAAAWRGRPAARVGGGGVSVRVCVECVACARVCGNRGVKSWNHTFRRVPHRLCRVPDQGHSAKPLKKTFYSPFAECQIGGHSAKLGFTECLALGKQIFANSILTCKTQKNKIQIKNKHYFMHNNFKLKLR